MNNIQLKIHMLVTFIALIGAVNWGLTAFGYNLVKIIADTINKFMKTDLPIEKGIYIIVALCGIRLALRKTTWLPFLGHTVLPASLIANTKVANPDKIVTVKVKPNAKVLYWAALDKGAKPNVKEAYADFSNSGIAVADSKGNVQLSINSGSGYVVPSGRFIPKHIHYREFGLSYGLMGPVHTVMYN